MPCGNAAESNRGRLLFKEEITSWANPPAGNPKLKEIAMTGETLEHEKTTVQSQRIDSNRNIKDVPEVDVRAAGDISFELAYGVADEFMAAALFADTTTDYPEWITPNEVSDFDSVAAGTGVYTKTGANFDTLFRVGQWVKFSNFELDGGSAANNGYFMVTAVSANTITVNNASSATDASPDASTSVVGSMIRNGTLCRSYYIEREHTDLASTFFQFRGMVVESMSLAFSANAIITGSFSFVGKEGIPAAATLGDGSPTAATINDSMNATKHVGDIYEGSTLAVMSEGLSTLNLTVANQLRNRPAIGHRGGIGIGAGWCEVTGDLEAYYENNDLATKIVNHSDTGIHIRVWDGDSDTQTGNAIFITIPRVKLTANPSGQIEGVNQDVMINPSLQGLEARSGGTPLGYTIQIDKFAA